jgi:hypothetical protein
VLQNRTQSREHEASLIKGGEHTHITGALLVVQFPFHSARPRKKEARQALGSFYTAYAREKILFGMLSPFIKLNPLSPLQFFKTILFSRKELVGF